MAGHKYSTLWSYWFLGNGVWPCRANTKRTILFCLLNCTVDGWGWCCLFQVLQTHSHPMDPHSSIDASTSWISNSFPNLYSFWWYPCMCLVSLCCSDLPYTFYMYQRDYLTLTGFCSHIWSTLTLTGPCTHTDEYHMGCSVLALLDSLATAECLDWKVEHMVGLVSSYFFNKHILRWILF